MMVATGILMSAVAKVNDGQAISQTSRSISGIACSITISLRVAANYNAARMIILNLILS